MPPKKNPKLAKAAKEKAAKAAAAEGGAATAGKDGAKQAESYRQTTTHTREARQPLVRARVHRAPVASVFLARALSPREQLFKLATSH